MLKLITLQRFFELSEMQLLTEPAIKVFLELICEQINSEIKISIDEAIEHVYQSGYSSSSDSQQVFDKAIAELVGILMLNQSQIEQRIKCPFCDSNQAATLDRSDSFDVKE